VVPSSTQFLFLNRTESVSLHRFNQQFFQQNRPVADMQPVLRAATKHCRVLVNSLSCSARSLKQACRV
jgi:hypothetical protein